jgi:hypothetical protein
MSSPRLKIAAAVACLLVATNIRAEAQVCGDADGSGTVTVTDGVQALRAAAGLSSSCGTGCDIDGSGTVTVTDGVNVLRKAAGLTITENCGGIDAQVETLLRNTLPTFGALTKLGTNAQAAESFCQNSEGEFLVDQETGEFSFFDCEIGGIIFDGTLGASGDTISFDLDFTIIATDEFFSFLGDLTARQSGENLVLAGRLEVDFSEFGFVDVTLEDVVSSPNEENPIGGSLLFDASDADIEGVVGIRVGFAPSTVVPVSVIFADQSTLDFNFDQTSGELTPASS